MSIFRLDYETTSACDIGYGMWRYAADPSTRILMFAIAENDEAPLLWRFNDPYSDESLAAELMLRKAIESESLLYAFNVGFEMAISTYRLGIDVGLPVPKIAQLRCTAAMARRAAIPSSLAKASEFLKLSTGKDTRGRALIAVFSDQSKLVTIRLGKESRKSASPILESPVPWDWTLTLAGETVTVREAWEMFCAYCITDVIVERGVHQALAKFELSGSELEGFLFDQTMNARGVPVNVPALDHAQVILDGHQERLVAEFNAITGLQPSQTAKVLEWLRNEGYPGDNLQSATMEEWRGSSFLTERGAKALQIRSDLSFAAIKKVSAMRNTVCPDGRMRGLLTWYGAIRTGRWTSTGPQLQNARKPTIMNPDGAYADICVGLDPDIFEILHDNPYEAVASCVRNFIQPHGGAQMIDTDLANIESRVAAMIAGQTDLLDVYREGRDAYKELAAKVFNVALKDVTKEQRFVGKVGNLSLVFQTGAKTFHETCAAWGMPIEKSIACLTVKTFRTENAQFPITWRKFESAATKAISTPGEWFPANEFVSFGCSRSKPFPRLMMRLPSGRSLIYPMPQVTRTVKRHRDYETGETREWESDDISFYGALRGHTGWGRISTYAGDLFQSSVQATARDILQHGCVLAEKNGFEIFSVIHDEALCHDGDADRFTELICTLPDWLPRDFPLAASTHKCAYYSK